MWVNWVYKSYNNLLLHFQLWALSTWASQPCALPMNPNPNITTKHIPGIQWEYHSLNAMNITKSRWEFPSYLSKWLNDVKEILVYILLHILCCIGCFTRNLMSLSAQRTQCMQGTVVPLFFASSLLVKFRGKKGAQWYNI